MSTRPTHKQRILLFSRIQLRRRLLEIRACRIDAEVRVVFLLLPLLERTLHLRGGAQK